MEGVPDWNLGYEILIAVVITLIFGLMGWLFASTKYKDDDDEDKGNGRPPFDWR